MTNLQRRFLRLEEKVQPNAKPLVINVEFVNAAKEPVRKFQVTVPMSGYPSKSLGMRS